MQWVKTEIDMCLNYNEGGTCYGAGGGRLRRVCVWCPNFKRREGTEGDEDGHARIRGGACKAGGTDQGASPEDGQPGETDRERKQASDQRGEADKPAGNDGRPDHGTDSGRDGAEG